MGPVQASAPALNHRLNHLRLKLLLIEEPLQTVKLA